MPSKGAPRHAIRIPDELWGEFQAATATADTNPSETIRKLIQEWVNNNTQGEK